VTTWWTDVDQAELDVLVFALVRDVFRHRARCADCAASGSGLCCSRVDDAIRAVLEWQRFRRLFSRAEWLAAEKNGKAA
jgi:hypothetical protein